MKNNELRIGDAVLHKGKEATVLALYPITLLVKYHKNGLEEVLNYDDVERKETTISKLMRDIPLATKLKVLFEMKWLSMNINPDRHATEDEVVKACEWAKTLVNDVMKEITKPPDQSVSSASADQLQPQEYIDLSHLPAEKKAEFLRDFSKSVTTECLKVFLSLGLNSHIEQMIVNGSDKKEYVFSFRTMMKFINDRNICSPFPSFKFSEWIGKNKYTINEFGNWYHFPVFSDQTFNIIELYKKFQDEEFEEWIKTEYAPLDPLPEDAKKHLRETFLNSGDRHKNRPKIITLCGSTKFKEQFLQEQKRLTREGNIIFSVGSFAHFDNEDLDERTRKIVDNVHKEKIMISDEIFVINVNNYIGESTKSEIEYAVQLGRKVAYLENN